MKNNRIPIIVLSATMLLYPDLAFATVESTLSAIQNALTHRILPVCAILGLIFAAFSFVAGNPNAKSHLTLAVLGAIIGFMAPSIVDFIQSLVN